MKESWNFENRKQDFNYSLYSFPAPRFHSIARLIRPYYSAGAVRTVSFQSPDSLWGHLRLSLGLYHKQWNEKRD